MTNTFIQHTKVENLLQKIEKEDVENVLSNRFECLLTEEENLKTELYLKMRLKLLRPSLLIEYTRNAWVDKLSNVRITIDKDVKSTTDCRRFFGKVETLPKEKYILEVKWDKYLPDHVLNIIQVAQGKKMTKSKFMNELIKYNYEV